MKSFIELNKIIAPAIITDASGLVIYKVSDDPRAEQYFLDDGSSAWPLLPGLKLPLTSRRPNERPGWDQYFLGIARAVAERSDCERDKVGAVLVKDRRIRSTGYNGAPAGAPGCESCPRRTSDSAPGSSYDNCVAIHAEGNCLLYADREDLIDATLYITREPCYACSKLIAGAGVSRVVY